MDTDSSAPGSCGEVQFINDAVGLGKTLEAAMVIGILHHFKQCFRLALSERSTGNVPAIAFSDRGSLHRKEPAPEKATGDQLMAEPDAVPAEIGALTDSPAAPVESAQKPGETGNSAAPEPHADSTVSDAKASSKTLPPSDAPQETPNDRRDQQASDTRPPTLQRLGTFPRPLHSHDYQVFTDPVRGACPKGWFVSFVQDVGGTVVLGVHPLLGERRGHYRRYR